jgi:hypothetical protein
MEHPVDENNYPLFDGLVGLKQKPMKTAMQELIEYLRSLAFSKCHLGMGDIMLTQGHIDEIEEKYIEKEKEQIIDFAMQMHKIDCSKTGTDLLLDEAEVYYNQTYNQNK